MTKYQRARLEVLFENVILLNDWERNFLHSVYPKDQYYVLTQSMDSALKDIYIKILENKCGIGNKALGEVEG